MGFCNFDVTITHFDRRSNRSCGFEKEYVVSAPFAGVCVYECIMHICVCLGINRPSFCTQVYVMKVACNGSQSWIAEKRYSGFVEFDEAVCETFLHSACDIVSFFVLCVYRPYFGNAF